MRCSAARIRQSVLWIVNMETQTGGSKRGRVSTEGGKQAGREGAAGEEGGKSTRIFTERRREREKAPESNKEGEETGSKAVASSQTGRTGFGEYSTTRIASSK